MEYRIHSRERATRGFGLFEIFLAKKRAACADKLIQNSSRKGKVLDIGCGAFPYFLSTTKFSEKFGVDASINEKKFKNFLFTLKKVNIEEDKLPFNDNFFETVTMLAVFEHISPNRLQFVLGQVRRVLKKNGSFIITTPAPWSDKLLHLLANIGLVSKIEIDEHKHALTQSMIIEILKKSGFASVTCGYFEFGLNMWFVSKK